MRRSGARCWRWRERWNREHVRGGIGGPDRAGGEAICQARDGNDAVVADYFGQGERHGMQALYDVRDQLGSVVGVADASGMVLGTARYGAYGVTTQARGVQSDFGYAGMLRDRGASLYLTQFRAYDPAVGHWLSRDPIGELGGENIYAYVRANPLGFTDLLGLSPNPMCGSGGEWPDWLKDKAKDELKDKVKEEAEKQCNEKYKGECGSLCECVYAAELAACGGPLDSACIIGKAKPKAEMCEMTCPESGTFTEKDAEEGGTP